MTKRLLLVLTEFPPSFGGMQTHAVALCKWLHERGYHIEVATYRLEEGPVDVPDFPFVVHRLMSRVSYHANMRKLVRLAREMRADLIYSSTVYYGELSDFTSTPIFCRSAGNDVLRPWIAWPFTFASSIFDLPWVERRIYRQWKRWNWPEQLEGLLLGRRRALMKDSAQRMEKIFANSDFTRQLLEETQVQKDRVVTLPGGVDSGFFAQSRSGRKELGLVEGEFYILTACRLVEKKGLDTLVEAMSILRRKGVKAKLLIAGEGRHRKFIEQCIERQDLGAGVTLLGYVNHEMLRDYLHACDMFVLSSREVIDERTGLRDAETMGRVLCEAAACGLPLVSTASGGIPSLIEDGVDGLLANPGCCSDLASKIEKLCTNRQLAAEMGLRAKAKAISTFDWHVLFGAHERAIEEMLASR